MLKALYIIFIKFMILNIYSICIIYLLHFSYLSEAILFFLKFNIMRIGCVFEPPVVFRSELFTCSSQNKRRAVRRQVEKSLNDIA